MPISRILANSGDAASARPTSGSLQMGSSPCSLQYIGMNSAIHALTESLSPSMAEEAPCQIIK